MGNKILWRNSYSWYPILGLPAHSFLGLHSGIILPTLVSFSGLCNHLLSFSSHWSPHIIFQTTILTPQLWDHYPFAFSRLLIFRCFRKQVSFLVPESSLAAIFWKKVEPWMQFAKDLGQTGKGPTKSTRHHIKAASSLGRSEIRCPEVHRDQTRL